MSERWQREASSFLLAGEATISLSEDEASALLAERLTGAALSSWEVRLAEARVGRVGVSPTRVAELLAGTALLPPGVSLDTRRASIRLTPRDLVPGIPLAVARLTVRDVSLTMGVRAAPR